MASRYFLYRFCAVSFAYATLVSAIDTLPGTIVIPGDVMIAGIFSVQENTNGICSTVDLRSVMNVEAIRWYLDNLNLHANLSFTIGFIAYKTCRIRGKEAESINDIIARSRTARDSQGLNHTYIVGVIGPELNSEAEVVSSAISSLGPDDQILQIGFSTTAAVLGNRTKFSNFYRVIPNNNMEVKVMIKTINKLGWTRFAIVHESDTYRRDEAYYLKDAVEATGACVVSIQSITVGLTKELNVNEIQDIVDGILIRTDPAINGVVFFGTDVTAKVFMTVANSKGTTTLPIFLMSEGLELNKDVFYDRNILITKALGSYTVSSPFKDIPEFNMYWSNLLQNRTNLQEKAQTNPWLSAAITYIQVVNTNISQSVYLHYALKAVHAISRTLISVITRVCSGLQLCSTFTSTFKPRMMSEEIQIRNITFNPGNDLLWNVSSLMGEFYLNISGEIIFEYGSPMYELYNFRKSGLEGRFEKIGNLTNDELNLDTSAIRDYDAGQREMIWPNIRKAECPSGKVCTECISPDIPDMILHIPGDLYVVGLVPVYEKNGSIDCSIIRQTNGYQLLEAIKYSLDKFNPGGEHSSVFGDQIRIGLLILNSCNSELIVKRKILDIHSNGVRTDQGIIDIRKRVIGYLGDVGSSVSIAAAQVLSLLGFVQVSYASASPQLNDRNEFPYFMRVTTSDDKQASVIIDIIKELNSEYVQLVYSDEAYGQGGRDALLKVSKEKRVCIVEPLISVRDSTEENFSGFYEKLRKNPDAKIVVVFVRSHLAVILMKTLTLQMKTGEFIFIGSATWGTNADILKQDNANKLIGSLTITMEMPAKQDLLAKIATLFPSENGSNPWMEEYLQSKLGCYFSWSFKKNGKTVCTPEQTRSLNSDGWLNFSAIAAESLLLGAGHFFKSKCSPPGKILCDEYINDPRGLVEKIKNVSLDSQGTGNVVKIFDENGDGNIGYKIYNIQIKSGNLSYENVGQNPFNKGLVFLQTKIQYPNNVPVKSPCPNVLACETCFTKISPAKTDDTKKPEVAVPALASLVGVLAAALIGLVIGIIVSKIKGERKDPNYITPRFEITDIRTERIPPAGMCEIVETTNSYIIMVKLNCKNKVFFLIFFFNVVLVTPIVFLFFSFDRIGIPQGANFLQRLFSIWLNIDKYLYM
ncbi:hypothetical protein ACJMK2_003713 [Sinanodonta woodiana]|uniref:Receptor ligand binding region domain-containing protein n=1 Tax=Sinanodonta woodiana TaxID=1069815 RepID=A0ABD3Y0U2_SINWO